VDVIRLGINYPTVCITKNLLVCLHESKYLELASDKTRALLIQTNLFIEEE